MSNTIQIRRGAKASLPTLSQGEWGLCTDTDDVYIGNGVTNIQMGNVVGPSSAPSDGDLVAFDGVTGKLVKAISVGSGLQISGGVLSATGGGGSGDSLTSTGNCTVDIDSDNSGTDALFKVTKHGGLTDLMWLDESGNLNIAGTITEAGLTSSGAGPLTTSQVWARVFAFGR